MAKSRGCEGEAGGQSAEIGVRVEFHAPPAALRRYFTTFYLVETQVPHGQLVTDHLHPEWCNLRLHSGDCPQGETITGSRIAASNFAVTGPSSRSVKFSIGRTRMWGIGLLPLGWSRFISAPANRFADALFDGHGAPEFASFSPLVATLFDERPDPAGELARITAHFLSRQDPEPGEALRIAALHAALVDPHVRTVADICDAIHAQPRTCERLCARFFGFPPKLLLRRQRFLRSLTHFMADPSLRWVGAIDGHYHDQAQFVRDFRQFMGMSPSEYARKPKPILGAIMKARAQFAQGHALQALDGPEGAPAPL